VVLIKLFRFNKVFFVETMMMAKTKQ